MGPNTVMPVSVCDSTAAVIGTAIRDSLTATTSSSTQIHVNGHTNHNGLNGQAAASLKLSMLTKIEYVKAPPDFKNSIDDKINTKYYSLLNVPAVSLNAAEPVLQIQTPKVVDHIPTPKKILFSRENVQIGWKTGYKWQVGAGMLNVGNTCYLNSTLQALFHVPAFANWLLFDDEHRESCEEISGSQGGCIVCAVSKTFIASQKSQQPMKPWFVYSKLRVVCRHLVPGHQEDAHEFLRYLMEAMEKAFLLRFKNSKDFDQYTKETTPINQILGGYLKSSVRCLACSHVSVTFQHFEDLLLDIRKANSIEEALDVHFARERLEDMGYKCEACKKKVSATKQFSLERPPIALCLQLKRFSMMGGKLNKQVTIKQKLDLSPYASVKSNGSWTYRLVSMVTHLGASQHCGHYTAIGLTENGSYYQFDDSCVRPISLQNVLNTNAYIVFYELDDTITKLSLSSSTVTTQNVTTTTTTSTATTTEIGTIDSIKSKFTDAVLEVGKINNSLNRVSCNALIPTQVKQTLLNGPKVNQLTIDTNHQNGQNRLVYEVNNNNNSRSPTKMPLNGPSSMSSKINQTVIVKSLSSNGATESKVLRLKISPKKEDSVGLNDNAHSPKKNISSIGSNNNNNNNSLSNTSCSNNSNNYHKTSNHHNHETKSESLITLSSSSTLPSMPKLDSPLTSSTAVSSSVSTSSINLPVQSPTTPTEAFGKLTCTSSIEDKCNSRSKLHNAIQKNGFISLDNHSNKPKSLVPYTSDDDSDSNQTNASQTSIKTTNTSVISRISIVSTTIANVTESTSTLTLTSTAANLATKAPVTSPTKSDQFVQCDESPSTIIRTNSAGDWHVSPCVSPKITAKVNVSSKSRQTGNKAASLHQSNNSRSNSSKQYHTNGQQRRLFSVNVTSPAKGTVNKLEKLAQNGYGAPVKSWSGQTSNMDREIAVERLINGSRKRTYAAHPDDEDFDRGRPKKIKLHSNINGSGTSSDNPGFNAFQEKQNQQHQQQHHQQHQHYRRPTWYTNSKHQRSHHKDQQRERNHHHHHHRSYSNSNGRNHHYHQRHHPHYQRNHGLNVLKRRTA